MPFTGPLEDRILIRELMDTYSHGVMTRDADLWASTWADDAFWALPEFPDLGGFTGKAAIVAGWVASMQVYGLDGAARPMVYVTTPGHIAVEGLLAEAIAYTSEIFEDPASGQLLRVRGRYDDVLEKHAGQWRFVRRTYRTLHIG